MLNPTKMNAALKKNGFKQTRNDNGTRVWDVKLNQQEREDADNV